MYTVDDDNIDEMSLDINLPDNKMVKRKLIPIDHGMSIPDSLDFCSFDCVWLSYA